MIQTDLVAQVAEAECLCRRLMNPLSHGATGEDCLTTGLRWPTLSRECPCVTQKTICDGCSSHLSTERFGHWHQDDCDCNGSGRVPDVSLEKVFPILRVGNHRQIRFTYADDGITRCIVSDNPGKMFIGYGEDEKEAACSALLAT